MEFTIRSVYMYMNGQSHSLSSPFSMGVPKSGRQVEAQYCLHMMMSYCGTCNFPSLKTGGNETAAEAAAVHQGRVDGDMSSKYNNADNKNKYIITIIWLEK